MFQPMARTRHVPLPLLDLFNPDMVSTACCSAIVSEGAGRTIGSGVREWSGLPSGSRKDFASNEPRLLFARSSRIFEALLVLVFETRARDILELSPWRAFRIPILMHALGREACHTA